MKKLAKIIGVLLLLVVIYAVGAILILGNKYHFEKSIVIHAPNEQVWQQVSSMKSFNQWNPWLKIDRNMSIVYIGNSGQVGDKYCWDSKVDEAGAGCQEIKELIPNQKQKTEMIFKKPFDGQAISEIILSPEGNNTKVTWTMDTEQDAMMKIMRPMMDYQMGKSYGEGLENLRALLEK